MRNVGKTRRADVIMTVQSYSRVPSLIAPSVEVALRRTGLDYFDVLLLGMRNDAPAEAYYEAFQKLREAGKVRFLALSTHNRPLLPSLFEAFEKKETPIDLFMVRYNAVHRGAEREVFPHLPKDPKPAMIAYTATRWGHLLDPKKMPPGEAPAAASDCYRFALTQPGVDLVLCGPANREQMQEALRTLELGPLAPEEIERMNRLGDHIYGRYKPNFTDRGDQPAVA
jgi:aryl-alcohol dehydrogenase-like predicted oxidoreductase